VFFSGSKFQWQSPTLDFSFFPSLDSNARTRLRYLFRNFLLGALMMHPELSVLKEKYADFPEPFGRDLPMADGQ
jgi:hypothetical protein